MLIQFEFLTEKARRKLTERQDRLPEGARLLLEALPEIMDRLERAVNPPRSARPIDRPRFVGPIVVDGRCTEPEAVTETVSSLIDAAIELSRAGWTRDPVGFWVSPDPTDGDALDTAGAIRKLRLVRLRGPRAFRGLSSPLRGPDPRPAGGTPGPRRAVRADP